MRLYVHSYFELLFTLVKPVLFIENDRLQIVPFRASVGNVIERGLRFRYLARFKKLFNLFETFGFFAVGLCGISSRLFYFLIRRLELGKVFGGEIARLAL